MLHSLRNNSRSYHRIVRACLACAAGLLAACFWSVPVSAQTAETAAQRDARMGWWRQARFGMFIHWGLYAQMAGAYHGRQTGGAGEWIMHDMKIPVADYAAQAAQFNPAQFDADAWVSIAKAAGMKYIVMTAKHHEGFPMFRTATDAYNIYDATPFKRDPIAEMAAACKKKGIKFGVYYSQAQDWHHAGGAAYGGHWDKAQDGDLNAYVKAVAAPQVRELLIKYHPAVLWWDTPVDMSKSDTDALTAAFPEDPGLIVNNRLGNGYAGDTETPEQTIPMTGFPGRDWETCMTINNTWGYKAQDTDFKSADTLLHNLIDIASKGGNYLLNVGPTGTGIIPAPEAQRLQAMGVWLKSSGDSVYGTSASPFKHLPFEGRATVKDDTLYLNVFTWPASGLTLTGLRTAVLSAKSLASGEALSVQRDADGTLTIGRPARLDPVSTAIALHLAGLPVVTAPLLTAQADGLYVLGAEDAELRGISAKLESSDGVSNIGFWTSSADTASWIISVSPTQAGAYQVALEYACGSGSGGSLYGISAAGANPPASVQGTVLETGAWQSYATTLLKGTLRLAGGAQTIVVTPQTMPHGAVMNLRRIVLIPVPKS